MAILLNEKDGRDKNLLTHCNICNNLISRFAEICPHCGHPDPNGLESKRKDIQYIQKIFIFSIFLAFLYFLSQFINH